MWNNRGNLFRFVLFFYSCGLSGFLIIESSFEKLPPFSHMLIVFMIDLEHQGTEQMPGNLLVRGLLSEVSKATGWAKVKSLLKTLDQPTVIIASCKCIQALQTLGRPNANNRMSNSIICAACLSGSFVMSFRASRCAPRNYCFCYCKSYLAGKMFDWCVWIKGLQRCVLRQLDWRGYYSPEGWFASSLRTWEDVGRCRVCLHVEKLF